MSGLLRSFKMDKTTLSVASLSDQSDQRTFWATKTPHERLAALEFLRVLNYGYDPSTAILQSQGSSRLLANGMPTFHPEPWQVL